MEAVATDSACHGIVSHFLLLPDVKNEIASNIITQSWSRQNGVPTTISKCDLHVDHGSLKSVNGVGTFLDDADVPDFSIESKIVALDSPLSHGVVVSHRSGRDWCLDSVDDTDDVVFDGAARNQGSPHRIVSLRAIVIDVVQEGSWVRAGDSDLIVQAVVVHVDDDVLIVCKRRIHVRQLDRRRNPDVIRLDVCHCR